MGADLGREVRDAGLQTVNLAAAAQLLLKFSRVDEALEHADTARALARAAGSRHETWATHVAGLALCRLGRHEEAMACHRLVFDLEKRDGLPGGQADALNGLALVHLACGRPTEAAALHRRALEIFRDLDLKIDTAVTLNYLADSLLARGDAPESLTCYQEALSIATAADDRYTQACALEGAAAVAQTQGDTAEARRHARAAKTLYVKLGLAAKMQSNLPDAPP
jgi:tetratricopeptide (TPR) repeat protein